MKLPTPTSRGLAISAVFSVVLGLGCAGALDALGIGTFAPHRAGSLLAVVVLAGVEATVLPALFRQRLDARRAMLGMLVGGVSAFILSRAPLGWLDLGALGAGPPGDLPLLVVPLVSVLAVFATWPYEAAEAGR